jgi:hypothetical protein
LPPALSAKDLPGGRTQILHVHQIWRVNRQPVNCDEHSAPASISDTEDWQNWNQDLNNPKDSKDNCVADIESDIQQDNSIEDLQCPEQQNVSTVPNFPRLIRPTGKFKIQTVMVLVTVNAMETRTNKGVKKQYDRMCQCFTSFFVYLVYEIYLEIYFRRMVSSSLWISVDKQMYCRRNKAFSKIPKDLPCESEQCKNDTALGFATWPHLN